MEGLFNPLCSSDSPAPHLGLHLSCCLPNERSPSSGRQSARVDSSPLVLFVSVIEGKVMRDLIELGPFLQPVEGVNLIVVLIKQRRSLL